MGSVVRSATRANSLFEVDSNIRRGITGVQLLTYERKVRCWPCRGCCHGRWWWLWDFYNS